MMRNCSVWLVIGALALISANALALDADGPTSEMSIASTPIAPTTATRRIGKPDSQCGRDKVANGANVGTQIAHTQNLKSVAFNKSGDWYDFGPPAAIVKRHEVSKHSVTLVTLSNGVRVALRPNKTTKTVLIQVEIDGGLRSLSLSSQPAAALGESMFVASGVGRKSTEELVEKYGPAVSSIEFSMYDMAFMISGEGEPKDLEGLSQVLTAYLADPGWRAQALRQAKEAEIASWREYRKWPHMWLNAKVKGLFLGGDPRWSIPSTAEIEATSIEDVKEAIGERLATGAIDITIAGDFDVNTALLKVAATFGTLPARSSVDVQPIRPPVLVAHTTRPFKIFHYGAKDKIAGYVAWPIPDTPGHSRTETKLSLMKRILSQRVANNPELKTDLVQGISNPMPGYWGISVLQSGDIEPFYSLVKAEASDMARNGVTKDELELARKYALKVRRDLQAKYSKAWAIALWGTRGDSVNVERALDSMRDLEDITLSEVQEVASEFLRDDAFIAATAYPSPPH